MYTDANEMMMNAPELEQTEEQTTTNASGSVPDQETVATAGAEGSNSLVEMVYGAGCDPDIVISKEETDQYPNLLCCPNGVIDLITGKLIPNGPDHLLIKNTNTPFSPEARFEPWEQFLDRICGGNERIKHFLQLAAGYTLQGTPREQVFFLIHGPSATGKSTFLEAFSGALGDYANNANFAMFLRKDRNPESGPSEDIARLAGTRLVFASEVNAGQRFDEAMLKSIAAGDAITARRRHENVFTFRPQLKLWLAANQLPFTATDDPAIWRRLIRIPFEHRPKELQPHLKALFAEEEARAAILAWAVRGAVEWFKTGLVVPPEIEKTNETASTEGSSPLEAPTLQPPQAEMAPEQKPTTLNRSLIGARAHFRGQLLAAFIGRLIGALRVLLFANHHTLDGVPFQIRTRSQRTFTINKDTEPAKIVVAIKVRDRALTGATRYALHGVRLEDAIAHGQKSTSRGHVKSGHLMVALGKVEKVDLGTIVVPDEFLLADDSDARRRLLQRIDLLPPDLDLDAVKAARGFVAGVEDEPIAMATNPANESGAPAPNATETGAVPLE